MIGDEESISLWYVLKHGREAVFAAAGAKHALRSYCNCESESCCTTAVELRDRLQVLDHVSLSDVSARETGDCREGDEELEVAATDETEGCRPAVNAVISAAYQVKFC